MRKTAIALLIFFVFLVIIPPLSAIDDTTKINIVYSGPSPIASAIWAKSLTKEAILKTATVTAMSAEKYPLAISPLVTIEKWRCTDIKCAYWISAVDPKGNTKAVNNPIWLVNGNAPYHILVSEVEDTKTNTITLTVKEDVKTAIFNILSDYAGRCPIGKPTTGTPL